MKIQNKYLKYFDNHEIKFDKDQQYLIKKLSQYFSNLEISLKKEFNKNLIQRLFTAQRNSYQSLYLYGSVGSGKTMILKDFFSVLPHKQKKYFHFHLFMQQIHKEIHIKRTQGTINRDNIISSIAKEMALENKIIFLDEMIINDIADAMIIGTILKELISNGVVLLITSNIKPENLYKDGIQQQSFLPTINFIIKNFNIFELSTSNDYRYINSQKMEHFFQISSKAQALESLSQLEKKLQIEKTYIVKLDVNGRVLTCNNCYKNIAIFSFNELFDSALSNEDYFAIVNKFSLIIIYQATELKADERNKVKRLINFIDIGYEKKIRLFLISSCPLDRIYSKGPLAAEFTRTLSRLNEMLANK
jgi:cell division protein ZapE